MIAAPLLECLVEINCLVILKANHRLREGERWVCLTDTIKCFGARQKLPGYARQGLPPGPPATGMITPHPSSTCGQIGGSEVW